ncbi:hypothetical protein [Spartinivicinus poritis]|uniref:Uncharacterized protein n=1 Tax=Spartinivicinus poritis TaxID=2994640 RepID=A0ABT5UEM3_9GAMM|nr:hypothetical protein [Spartinivicinus sp. A2-2]MDE1464825.1 hypothetical protein [Spartinivicinus sp. A2-2]
MINDKLGLQPWKQHTRVFKYNLKDANEIDIAIAEFALDQSAGIANQAIVKMVTSSKPKNKEFDIEKLSEDNQKLINKIYQYIEFFEDYKGRQPYFIWLTPEQVQSIKSDCKKAGIPPPKSFRGVLYMRCLGVV